MDGKYRFEAEGTQFLHIFEVQCQILLPFQKFEYAYLNFRFFHKFFLLNYGRFYMS